MNRELSAIEQLMNGYDKTEKKELDKGQEQEESIQKDNKEERELSAIEKLMAGYNPNSTQKEKEVNLEVSEEKKRRI